MDLVNEERKYGSHDRDIFEKYNSSNIDNPRVVVITEHNSKSYQVDKMTTEYNPKTYFFTNRAG